MPGGGTGGHKEDLNLYDYALIQLLLVYIWTTTIGITTESFDILKSADLSEWFINILCFHIVNKLCQNINEQKYEIFWQQQK